MRWCIILFMSCYVVSAHRNGILRYQYPNNRQKRDAVGQLDILTNHAQPIHADVKIENNGMEITPQIDKDNKNPSQRPLNSDTNSKDTNLKAANSVPCPEAIMPSHVEEGTVFKVTAPQDVNVVYHGKSLRKSWPLTSQIDLIRSISRILTLSVLIISAIVEFYPLVQHMFNLSR